MKLLYNIVAVKCMYVSFMYVYNMFTYIVRRNLEILLVYIYDCRVTTGENWQDVMLSCKSNSPCDNPEKHNSCGSDVTYFFYPFFYAIASILVR